VTYKSNETEYQKLFETQSVNDMKYHVFSAQKHDNLLKIKLNSQEEIIEIPRQTSNSSILLFFSIFLKILTKICLIM
jgi:hypothetical protein